MSEQDFDDLDENFEDSRSLILDLDRIGEVAESVKFLVYLNIPGSKTFGTNDLAKHINERGSDPVNDLIQYLMMREKNCTISEAINYCINLKPTLIVEDVYTLLKYSYPYEVYH